MSEPSHDEVFCTSCGEVIKEEAEICPECGTNQLEQEESAESGSYDLPDMKQHELEKIANKDPTVAILLGLFISPGGYIYAGSWGWAAINFFTLNYFLFGIIIVPIHARKMILDAREELRQAGVEGY